MMNRRFICIVLSVTLVLASIFYFSGPVEASEDDDLFRSISLLDYDMPGDGSITALFLNFSAPYTMFDLPFSYGLLYYDVIIETRAAPSAVYIRGSTGNTYQLTVKNIEGYKYRCYGASSTPVSSSRVGLQVDFSGSSFYINFLKFDVYTMADPAVDELGEMYVTPSVQTTPVWLSMSSPGQPLTMNFYNWARDGYQDYEVLFSSVNWKKFDYIDFKMKLHCSTIKSIVAEIRDTDSTVMVPFEISWLDGSAMSNNQFIANGEMADQMGQLNAQTTFTVNLRLFIPNYARDSGSLIITFNGQYPMSVNGYYSQLQKVTGYYITDVPDPQLTKLDQIRVAIEQSLSSSAEQNAAASDFKDSMQQQNEQVSANQDFINSVERPESGSLGDISSPDLVLDTASGGMSLLVSMIRPITESKKYLAVLTLVASLALVSYVFFGKKK